MLLLERNSIELPIPIFEAFRGKKVEIKLIDHQKIISETSNSINELKGILKTKNFNTNIFFKNKQEDKTLEPLQ